MKAWAIKNGNKYVSGNGALSSLSNAQLFSRKKDAEDDIFNNGDWENEKAVKVEIKEIK